MTKDRNYRNSPAPVPFHAVCNGLSNSMHAEIVALHSLLKEPLAGLGEDVIEEMITDRIEGGEEGE